MKKKTTGNDIPSLLCYPSFSISRNQHGTKKKIGNCPVEEVKKMKCYKRLIYKQFIQISALCGPQFLSYLPKHLTYLCRTLYGDAIYWWWTETVHQYGPRKSTKTSGVHFSIKALPFHSRASIRAHKHIF